MLLLLNCLQLYNKLQYDAENCSEYTDAYIMLEEFYIFAAELAHLCEQGTAVVPMNASCSLHGDGKDTKHKIGSKRMAYEVFLGGSCNPTTWRSDIAIPTLQNLGITYYNPQVSQWGPELIAQEYEAKQTARVLLFVIDNQTRNSAGIIEAAQLAAIRSESLVLVIYPYRQGQAILGETVSTQEYYDLMNGLLVLQYLMERQRVPIFESVSVALHCTSKMLREEINVQDCVNTEDGIKPIRISLTQNGTDVVSMRLSLYRPSLNEYNVRILPQELQKIKNSRLILLIVPQHSRGIAIMALAAHLIGLHAKLVLCVQILPEGSIISDEQLTEQARKDYNRGRMYLSDFATREGVPVFQNIADALQHAIQLVQNPC
ncbi:PREDICTED: uncharacterized protein LOC105622790 [Atta cephalotes]|uniref:Uncharacterized protein n=1 Tax=Atta cephalotes TaxID=12957 RepID=A0A158NPY4_ATTCE|nr:PREDICTED: uncharacterized protein LOC105622790 [Atta cephalotes]